MAKKKDFSIKKDGEDWKGQDIEVKSDTLLVDAGKGEKFSLRTFQYKTHPDILSGKKPLPSKQELFNAHAKQIEIEAYKDGLKVIKDDKFEPTVLIAKDKSAYAIAIWCEVGSTIEDSKTLQQIFDKSRRTKKKI